MLPAGLRVSKVSRACSMSGAHPVDSGCWMSKKQGQPVGSKDTHPRKKGSGCGHVYAADMDSTASKASKVGRVSKASRVQHRASEVSGAQHRVSEASGAHTADMDSRASRLRINCQRQVRDRESLTCFESGQRIL